MALEMKRIKLAELAFACHVYAVIGGYDETYYAFVRGTQPSVDLQKAAHLQMLLNWLRTWGCRQFAKAYDALAATNISEWHRRVAADLAAPDAQLITLSEGDLADASALYAGLFERTASIRRYPSGKEVPITIGPTGAAKILFALRPNVFVPWDDPMRAAFKLDGSAPSYRNYLRGIQLQLESLGEQCAKQGFPLTELPSRMGRPESSCPKLIDEFYWVTVTRKWPIPDELALRTWAGWL
jgi:hypothetical protein